MSRPTIHLFFNGEGLHFPPGAAWEQFRGLDAMRTFAICAESWRRQGWDVERLSTIGHDFEPTRFKEGGECEKSFHWYPAQYWQFIAKAKTVARPGELTWFLTMDVINFGFSPPAFQWLEDFAGANAVTCVNLQTEHESLACFAATLEWIEEAERILLRYDRGELAPLRRDYTSDETILRNYSKMTPLSKLIMASNTTRDKFPLLHFARSTMKPIFESVPLSVPRIQERPAISPLQQLAGDAGFQR